MEAIVTHDNEAALMFEKTGRGDAKPVVDFAVYGTNRAFRLLHSSKFGVNVPFQLWPGPMTDPDGAEAAVLYLHAMASVLPEGDPVLPARLPSAPVALSRPVAAPFGPALPRAQGAATHRVPGPQEQEAAELVEETKRTRLLLYLHGFWARVHKRWADGLEPLDEDDAHAAGLRALDDTPPVWAVGEELVPIPGERLRVAFSKARYCANIGRPHNSRWIKLIVDPSRSCFWQMCYDDECRFYSSRAFRLPNLTSGHAT